MPDGRHERPEVPKAEERSYQFVAEDPGVATMSTTSMLPFYFILHLSFMKWVLLLEVSF